MTDDTSAREPDIRISVSPEPTDEEAAAIVAAVAMLMATRGSQDGPGQVVEDRWKVAGRLEALRSSDWPPLGLRGRW